jgi:hypothetical protein
MFDLQYHHIATSWGLTDEHQGCKHHRKQKQRATVWLLMDEHVTNAWSIIARNLSWTWSSLHIHIYIWLFAVLGIELRALFMQGNHATTEYMPGSIVILCTNFPIHLSLFSHCQRIRFPLQHEYGSLQCIVSSISFYLWTFFLIKFFLLFIILVIVISDLHLRI